MRFAIFGAGAIGGYLGAKLAHAGEDVTFIARGATLAALRDKGLRVVEAAGPGAGGEFAVRPRCTDDLAALGEVDAVFLTVKANTIPSIAAPLGRALGPETAVVTGQNGLPWW